MVGATTLNKEYISTSSDKEDIGSLLLKSRKLKDRMFKIAAMVFSFITIAAWYFSSSVRCWQKVSDK